MDGAAAPRAADAGENLRMLAELESAARPMDRSTGRRSPAWIAAFALLMATGAGAWWWSQQRAAPVTERPIAGTIATAPVVAPVVAPVAAPVTAAATPPAGAAPVAASTTARIEAMPPAAPAAPATAASPAAPTVAAPDASKPAAAPARVAHSPVARTPAKRPTKVAAAPSRRPSSGATPQTRSAAARAATADRGNGKDADIVLLSALLAHVSREGQAGTLASNDQMTIAQIVQRCEARGGEDSRECRRRICDGYWGKAQACPARLAPKKG